MIDKRSPKGFIFEVFVVVLFCLRVRIKDLQRKEEGYISSGPRCLASSAPFGTTLSGSFAMLVSRCPVWEDKIIKRKDDGLAINLPKRFSLGGYH